MKKSLRKLIPTFVMLIITAALVGTSTFAWFSMNNKVTVTGMKVSTRVSNSILIAPSTTDATGKADDDTFKTNYVAHTESLLEPVSTVDGVTFFYNSTNNTDSEGGVIARTYIAYDPTSTGAFNTNYNTTGAVGYVDYAFQLKVTNTDSSATYYVNLTELELLYNGAATAEKAFRVAMFVNDMGADGNTAATAPTTDSLKTILRPTGATYRGVDNDHTVKAASAVDAIDTVNGAIDTAANIGSIAHGETRYFKVVIRLWLEGEDSTCNNETFATLQSSWALNLAIELESSTTNCITVLGYANDANTADLTGTITFTAAANNIVIDGITYKEIDGITLNGTKLYAKDDTITTASQIFTISGQRVTDVTNQCKLGYVVTVNNDGATGIAAGPFIKTVRAGDTITISGLDNTLHTVDVASGTATAAISAAGTLTISAISADSVITITNA